MLSSNEELSLGDGHGGHSGTTVSVPDPWWMKPQEGEKCGEDSRQDSEALPFLNEDARGRKAGWGRRARVALGGTVGPRRKATTTHFLTFHSKVIRMGI